MGDDGESSTGACARTARSQKVSCVNNTAHAGARGGRANGLQNGLTKVRRGLY